MRIALEINGKPVEAEVEPRTHLADFLRERLLLTGTHLGCEHGICGACTVEIDGEIARSCITYTVSCDGAAVRTIEGFDDDPLMARLRRAFTEEHALQCGYCTPGMLIAARDLVRRKSDLSRDHIRYEMSGNLCRCTGYVGIINAIERVMAERTSLPPGTPAQAHWLGPAPGPVTSHSDKSQPAQVARAPESSAREHAAIRSSRVKARRSAVEVTVSALEEINGETRLTQSFLLAHPRDLVWLVMKNPEAVAACIPGMSIDAPPTDGHIRGCINVKLGPISASFAGEATIHRIDADYRQIIAGKGGDKNSGSRASGKVDYRLSEEIGADGLPGTRVDVVIAYVLTGALAQFGRSGLARDLVAHMGKTFAQNVDAELAAPGSQPVRAAALGGLSLIFATLLARLKQGLSRLCRAK